LTIIITKIIHTESGGEGIMSEKINIHISTWKVEARDHGNVITGRYEVKAGAAVIADQEFNGTYGNVKIAFSLSLQQDIERITERIIEEIKDNFFGKE
jgi:hypothetical protein